MKLKIEYVEREMASGFVKKRERERERKCSTKIRENLMFLSMTRKMTMMITKAMVKYGYRKQTSSTLLFVQMS